MRSAIIGAILSTVVMSTPEYSIKHFLTKPEKKEKEEKEEITLPEGCSLPEKKLEKKSDKKDKKDKKKKPKKWICTVTDGDDIFVYPKDVCTADTDCTKED